MINIARPLIGQEEKDAVLKVMDSGMIACGQTVSYFEKEFAKRMGVKNGIATTSGTTALEVSLHAMGIGFGDKVITTAYSFIASTNSILYVGATPVFVDIDVRTFNISIDGIRMALQEHPDAKALLVVHLFGQACDMNKIMELAKEFNVKVIEDCAQAHDAEWDGRKVGSFGDVAAYSFYPTKNMTTGEGGMVLTNNEEIAENARLLINHGMKIRYQHEKIGYNYRMTNIAAAIGLEQLKKLDNFNEGRRKNAEYYNNNLINPLIDIPFVSNNAKHVYHQYTIKIKKEKRDALIKLLEDNQIGYGVFYPFSIPEQPAYAGMGFKTEWETTDVVKKQVISIPVLPSLMEEEIRTIVAVLNDLE